MSVFGDGEGVGLKVVPDDGDGGIFGDFLEDGVRA